MKSILDLTKTISAKRISTKIIFRLDENHFGEENFDEENFTFPLLSTGGVKLLREKNRMWFRTEDQKSNDEELAVEDPKRCSEAPVCICI